MFSCAYFVGLLACNHKWSISAWLGCVVVHAKLQQTDHDKLTSIVLREPASVIYARINAVGVYQQKHFDPSNAIPMPILFKQNHASFEQHESIPIDILCDQSHFYLN